MVFLQPIHLKLELQEVLTLLPGLPDGYGRGRIIGDYRRIALYGVDALIEDKKEVMLSLEVPSIHEETVRDREEVHDQIDALNELKVMASEYGFDISRPSCKC